MEEQFKLNKTNVALIILTIGLLIIIGLLSIVLVIASQGGENNLPELEVIVDKTSTTNTRTTTTTLRVIDTLQSPYYTYELDNVLPEEMYTSQAISIVDLTEIIKSLFNTSIKIIDIKDSSLLDVNRTLKYGKTSEKDIITVNGFRYVMIYDGEELLNKVFTKTSVEKIYKLTYKGRKVFIKNDDGVYRLEPSQTKTNPLKEVIAARTEDDQAIGDLVLFDGNLRVNILFEDNRWKLDTVTFPDYEMEETE